MNKLAVPFALLAWSSHALASLVLASDPAWGPGTLTQDTSTGLSWLTPTVTSGLSYSDVRGLLQSDVRYSGFRVASTSELADLFTNAGIPDINVAGYGALYGTTANVSGVAALQSFVGVTYQYQYSGLGFLYETAGYVDVEFVSPVNGFLSVNIGNLVVRTAVNTGAGVFDFASAYSTWGSVPVGSALQGVGTWLVRQEVPEPSTLALVALAFAIAIKQRRR
jgi:hypothetical protein